MIGWAVAMISKSSSRQIVAVIGSLMLVPTVFPQGPLAPTGPPVPTMKSLNQIDTRVGTAGERIPVNATTCPGDANAVYVIAQRGSYFLTGNVIGVAGKNGIHISSPEVTLDLNGYQLDGAAVGVIGILIDQDSVTVRNGRVLNWSSRAIDAEGPGARSFERVVAANSDAGFFIFGQARYESCCAINNRHSGFDGFLGHQYHACFTSGNGDFGFVLFDGNTAESCLSLRDSIGYIFVGSAIVARGCTASQFQSFGFYVQTQGASLVDCVATTSASGGSAYVILDPAAGVPSAAVFNQCTAAYFPGPGGNTGFDASGATGVTFSACVATGWGTAGFSVGLGSTVSDCSASNNSGCGIVFSDGGAIIGNTSFGNRDGISGVGAQNRLDGNTVTGNSGTGILVTDATNVVVRNLSRNPGSNYSPLSGTNIGPTGQTPGGASPATSPWANF